MVTKLIASASTLQANISELMDAAVLLHITWIVFLFVLYNLSISTNVFRSRFHINFAVPAPKGSDAFGFLSRLLLARLGGAVILRGCADGWMALPAPAPRVRQEEMR